MRKLSPPQAQLVDRLKAGAKLTLEFDVWGPRPNGNWFSLLSSDGKYRPDEQPQRSTINALVSAGILIKGETTRPYSGHRRTPYTLAAPA